MKGKKEDWETEEPEISPNEPIQKLVDLPVYKSSQDKHGHEVFLGAKFPKNIGRWVQAILERESSPYEIRSDVVRDAIYLGLRILNIRYKLDHRWMVEEKLARIRSRVANEALFYEQELQYLRELGTMYKNGYREQAKKELKEYLENLGPLNPKRAKVLEGNIAALGMYDLLEEISREE